MENQAVSLTYHRKTGSGVSVSSNELSRNPSDIRMSVTSVGGAEEDIEKNELLRFFDAKEEFKLNLDRKLFDPKSPRLSMGDLLQKDKSPTNTPHFHRSQTLSSAPSIQSIQSNTSFASIEELDSAYTAYLEEEDSSLPSHQEIKQRIKKNPEMNKIRSQFEDHLECLDTRLENQKTEISDIQDYFKRRADIERKYSKDLEALNKHMTNKHRENLQNKEAVSSTAILRELVKETRKTGRNHAVVGEIFGTEMSGICGTISSDISRVYKQCRDAGVEIQEKVLGVLFDLHVKTKIYQANKDNYEQAKKKLTDAEKDIAKIEKDIPKPEKREKTKKFTNAQKVLKNRHIRHEDTHSLAIKSQAEYMLCTEAANAALKKYYKDDISDLMNCMDLGFHHLLKNLLKMRTSAIENCIVSEQEDIDVMNMALDSLDSRKDKAKYLDIHTVVFSPPEMFELKTNKSYQSTPEEMDHLKAKIQAKIVKLRGLSEYTAKVIEDAEAELLQIFNDMDFDMTSLFAHEKDDLKVETEQMNSRIGLEELLIENNKRLIITNNSIEQEEAKYQNLKKSLVVQQFCPETLPRPGVKKRKSKIQTIGLPKIFGGSLDDYYEATGEKIPLVIESCIRTIKMFGMRHQGIFRVTGSHVDMNKFEEAFENGEDPFACMTDGNQMNSVSGILKGYFRKLNEPLFSEEYFDQFMNITNIGENVEFVVKARDIVRQWSEPHIVVTRYLFSFLNDLSQFSDETQMDAYNIAICFGPNLCPIPEGKDLVQHTNLVNDLIKNFLIFCDDIFHDEIEGPLYIRTDAHDDQAAHADQAAHGDQVQEDETKVSNEDQPKLQPEEAVALYDYKSGTAKELSFNKGDSLLIFSKASDHWWKGSKDGLEGLIPARYVQIRAGLDEKQEDSLPKKTNIDEDCEPIVTKQLSFKSNRNLWEERENKTLERPQKRPPPNPVTAPDLLQDLLDKQLAKTTPSRSRSGSTLSAGRMSPGQDVPDNIVASTEELLEKLKQITEAAPNELRDDKR